MLRTKDGLWEDYACTARLKSICEKPSKKATPPGEGVDVCNDPSCCNGQLGAHYGGALDDESFTASSTWQWNSPPKAGRLNKPNDYLEVGDIHVLNNFTGGWIASADDKEPWLQVNFKDTKNGSPNPFYAEVKGIITQGISGYKKKKDWLLWTKQFTIEYQGAGGDGTPMIPIVDHDGNTIVWDANGDKDTEVTNTFPYALVTKAIKVKPVKWSRDRAGMRLEFIGCKTGCIKSLGVCQDSLVFDEAPINQVLDAQMSASSQLPGKEAHNGRLHYAGTYMMNLQDGQKVFNPYNSKKSYPSAQNGCMASPGGASVLATITSSSDQSAAQSAAQQYANGNECFWIGMKRVNGQYEWDDGTTSDYNNWSPNDNQNNACVCLSVAENYKWVTRDCEQMYPYICNRVESGKVWTAQYADTDQYLQVDLGTIMKVSGIMTQGNPQADEWVSQYTLQFSDKDRNDWKIYLNHDGTDAALFDGNTDRFAISEGILRQPITARFVRVVPTKWEKKISMRIDIIGCKSGDRTDCLDNGDEFVQSGNDFTVDCPADCDKIEPQQVWGTQKYALESSVCQAAIHDGRIAPHSGGSITFKLDAKVPESGFAGSEQHGIFSDDLPLDDDHTQAMIFESDHIGCEAGWKGFRNSCFRIPKDHANVVSWSEAKTICEDEGGWLATVPDKQTKSYLYSIIRNNNNLNHLWIGLTDEGHPNYYEKWSNPDQTPVSYLNWERNKPSMKQRDPFNCVMIYRASFLYKNEDCSRHLNYMCERPKRPTNHIDTEDEGCRAGWSSYGDRCYLFKADGNSDYLGLL